MAMCILESSINSQRARKIMGGNMFDLKLVSKLFEIDFTARQQRSLRQVPFPSDILQKSKETHILFVGYPLSISDLRKKMPREFFCNHADKWCESEDFAKEAKVDLRWYLMRKDVLPQSPGKTFQEQLALLKETEEVPRACELAYMLALYYLAQKKSLFEEHYLRCEDVVKDNTRVGVSFFKKRLGVVYIWDKSDSPHIGITVSCKPWGF